MTAHTLNAGSKQRGFSLVEFMVALLLGTILIGGAVAVYLASTRSFQEAERSVKLLDNGRFALQILGDSLRHAGFFGGVDGANIDNDGALNPISSADDCTGEAAAYNLDTYIFATTADGAGAALGCITDAVPGSDVLVVKSLLPNPLSDDDPNDPTPTLDGAISFPNVPAGDTTYVVANAELGLLVDGADTLPNVSDGETYARGQAWPYSYQVFYIRVVDATADPNVVALARRRLNFDSGSMGVTTENLVRGVADMRIRFRYDSDDDGDIDTAGYADDIVNGIDYPLDDDVNNWNRVGSVEIFLLAQSLERDRDYVDQKTYTLGDRTVTPNDDLWRMLINQHIGLRNPNLVIHGGGV